MAKKPKATRSEKTAEDGRGRSDLAVLPDGLPDGGRLGESITGWALALSRYIRTIGQPPLGRPPATLDELVAQQEKARRLEQEEGPLVKAFKQAHSTLSVAASSTTNYRAVVSRILSPDDPPIDETSPALKLGITAPRNFETPIEDKVSAYYKAAFQVYGRHEGLEVEQDAHRRLQAAVALQRLSPSDAHAAQVEAAAANVRYHGVELSEDEETAPLLPEGHPLWDEHPMFFADSIARKLDPRHQNELAVREMLERACSLIETAQSLADLRSQAVLAVARTIVSRETQSLPRPERRSRSQNRSGRPPNPINLVVQEIIAELVKTAPPGSPSEIAEIISTRYQHPITAAEVSTHIANMKKADLRDGARRRLPIDRRNQKSGRRPVKR